MTAKKVREYTPSSMMDYLKVVQSSELIKNKEKIRI